MLKKILIIFSFVFSIAANADEAADKAEFKRLYAEFNDLYASSEELDPIIEVAEKVYEIAPKAYGEDHMNTAVVTYNLASLYDEKGKNSSNDAEVKAVGLYKNYFSLLDDLNVPKDANYLIQYVSFVIAENNAMWRMSRKRYADNAIKMIENISLPSADRAELQHKLALIKVNQGLVDEAKALFESSRQNYTTAAGEDHIGVGQNLFWLAKIDVGDDHSTDAIEKFLQSIEIFDQNGVKGHDLALISHANLVQIYEKNGQSDEATKHCIAASVERPLDFDRFVTPLYRENPKYPSIASRSGKEGWVLLEFDVDEEGFTMDPKVIESSSLTFERVSLEAAAKYRYAPSIRNGKRVPTKGVRVRIVFQLRS